MCQLNNCAEHITIQILYHFDLKSYGVNVLCLVYSDLICRQYKLYKRFQMISCLLFSAFIILSDPLQILMKSFGIK